MQTETSYGTEIHYISVSMTCSDCGLDKNDKDPHTRTCSQQSRRALELLKCPSLRERTHPKLFNRAHVSVRAQACMCASHDAESMRRAIQSVCTRTCM